MLLVITEPVISDPGIGSWWKVGRRKPRFKSISDYSVRWRNCWRKSHSWK